MKRILMLFIFSSFILFACQKSADPLLPELSVVDENRVKFNGQTLEITTLTTHLNTYRNTIDGSEKDSIQIQMLMKQGIDKTVLTLIKDQVNASQINDLKFVAQFD